MHFRVWLLWLVPVVLLSAVTSCRNKETAASYQARIGVAIKLEDRVCMAIHNAKLLPSAIITLLEPAGSLGSERAETARAEVLATNANACPGTKDDSEVSNYNLLITTGTVRPYMPLVALEARVPSVYAAHSFHSCANADGFHLTAWDGARALEGHRLWNGYYYTNYDLASNCTSAETAP